jgi:hypothetical protein
MGGLPMSSQLEKSILGAWRDGLSRQSFGQQSTCNKHGAFINSVLSILVLSNGLVVTHNCFSIHSEWRSNRYISSNGYIASSWRSTLCHCSDISTKLQFCNSSCCEVSSRTSCNLTVLALFFLNFLAFFPVSFVSVILLPF